MEIRIKAIAYIVIIILPIYLNAQVTIGMGSAPARTALLQLKDKEANLNGDIETSQTGGLLLPRTRLIDKQTLEPYVQTNDPDYDIYKKESIGLIVYNIATTADLSPGIYHWDGDEWLTIGSESDKPNPIIRPDPEVEDIDDPEALKLPNSYILPRSTTLEFQVIKGYAAWKHDIKQAIDGGIIPTVELVWQTRPELVKSVSVIEGNAPHLARLRVEASDISGNALVAMKIGNEIKWSWHIWITDYEPEKAENQRQSETAIFMDRNIGALRLSRDRKDILTFGMVYQWGRKDPFPGSDHWEEEEEDRALFLIDNQSTEIVKEAIPSSTDNRALVCKNPSTFYNNPGGDWFSSTSSSYNHYLWITQTGKKGIYDPCPRGWRVPLPHSWQGLPCIPNLYASEREGLDWSKPGSGYNGGHYPYCGYRKCASGGHLMNKDNNLAGFIWSTYARDDVPKSAYPLYYYRWGISPPTSQAPVAKAQGNAVRCIKDID